MSVTESDQYTAEAIVAARSVSGYAPTTTAEIEAAINERCKALALLLPRGGKGLPRMEHKRICDTMALLWLEIQTMLATLGMTQAAQGRSFNDALKHAASGAHVTLAAVRESDKLAAGGAMARQHITINLRPDEEDRLVRLQQVAAYDATKREFDGLWE